MNKIAKEVAIQEVNEWLDFKKIKDNKREESKQQIEELVTSIESGILVIDENKNIIQTLEFPITNNVNEITVSKISYKPRLNVRELNDKLKAVKGTDVDARIMAYATALTGEVGSIIGKLDTEDYRLTSSIVMFFL